MEKARPVPVQLTPDQVADIASRGSAAIANSLPAASNAFLLFKASKAQSTFRLPRSVLHSRIPVTQETTANVAGSRYIHCAHSPVDGTCKQERQVGTAAVSVGGVASLPLLNVPEAAAAPAYRLGYANYTYRVSCLYTDCLAFRVRP